MEIRADGNVSPSYLMSYEQNRHLDVIEFFLIWVCTELVTWYICIAIKSNNSLASSQVYTSY